MTPFISCQHSSYRTLPGVCALTLLCLLLQYLPINAWAQPTGDILVIAEMQALESTAAQPPPANADWQPMALPFATRIGEEEHVNRVLWLQFELERPDSDALHSLYFYRYNLAIDVFLNGEKIGGDNYRDNRHTMAWNHPRLIDIQNANWRDGNNRVAVRFQGSYFGGTFAPVLFAERAVLQPLYETRLLRQVRVNEWLQASGIIVTVLALTLWAIRRRDPIYPMFAGMTACWLVLITHMVTYYNLFEYGTWLPIVHAAMDIFALLLFAFLSRFANMPSPRVEKVMVGWTALAMGWHVFGPLSIWWMGAYATHAVGNLFIVYLLIRISKRALTERDRMSVLIALMVIAQIALFLHDFLLTTTGSNEDWESAIYWSQFALPLLILVFTIGLLNRFTSALNLAEELNRDLEAKVEASRKVIAASYQEQRELEISKAAEEERIKIYRDLHDDVGSKLLSIVHAGRDHKLGELARTALASLRDAVSRANSPEQPLRDFLEAMREETQLRLEGTGHQVTWIQTGDIPEIILSSATVYHLNQIMRELVSNIIRHAQASEVEFLANFGPTGWTLQVSDNGRGLDPGATNGNGLGHIRQRASEINCQIDWRNRADAGLQIQMAFPASAATAC